MDILYDGTQLILDALHAHEGVEFRKNILFALGNETLGGVDVHGLHDLAAAVFGPHIDIFRHLFGKMAVGMADILLAHVPCEMGAEPGW